MLYTNERVFKEFGISPRRPVIEKVKEALERGRRVLDSEDADGPPGGDRRRQDAARHLTEVMLMDPSRFLSGMAAAHASTGDGNS